MTFATTRNVVVVVFLSGLLVGCLIFFAAYAHGTISAGDLTTLMTLMLASYSVHLGVILGGVFGAPNSKSLSEAGGAGVIATVVSIIWNALVIGRLILFGLAVVDVERTDSVDDVSSYVKTVAASGSFLVVGALTFFFATQAKTKK